MEYYASPASGTGLTDTSDEGTSEDEEEEEDGDVMIKVGKTEKAKISDELSALGFYARSMKPAKGWVSQSASSSSPCVPR